jgi:1A family penicillin-binding protein
MKKSGKRRLGALYIVQLFIIALLIGIVFFVSAFLVWAATIKIPDFSLFETRKVSQSTKLYDRTGEILLYDVHKDIRRTNVAFEKISPYIKNASIAIEDEQFYSHIGIQPKAILRATLVNLHLRAGYAGQGGSTITQQVIKNSLLTSERTITRKLKEWILAIKLERQLSKDQILSLYLNEAPYGGNIYGVEEASMSYFGVHASDVTLAEAAYIAALPQSPTRYSPYGNNINLLEDRKELVLKKMHDLHSITDDEYNKAEAEKVRFVPQQAHGMLAPHFVMFVKEKLVEMYGEDALNEDGLRVVTSIDMDLQKKGEDIVKKYAAENAKAFNANNAALVAIDPKNGQILTMVGSRDYFDITHDGNFNIALAKRQPGSAFKPFVYAAGFELGYTPDTVLFDVPTEFSTRCDTQGNPLPGSDASMCYMPENYDHQYRGPMSVRDALSQSVNVPAVKMLYLVGLDKAIDFAERLGLTTLGPKERYGLTLVLGGGEVSLLEMTSAYGVFANDGARVPYTSILSIKDTAGNTLFENTATSTQVIDPEIARKMSDVLSDNVARTPAFGAQSFLNFSDHKVAVKTGTTNDYRDAWIIGYTPSLVVGAWAGNNDNTPMEKKVAGFIIAPLWNAFFTSAFSKIPNEKFPSPQPIAETLKPALRGLWYGGEVYNVDKLSGKLATEYTPKDMIEERVIPNPHDILYWVNKSDPMGDAPTNPYNDPQFLLWEVPAQQWIGTNGLPSNAYTTVPSTFDSIHGPQFAPQISVLSPTSTGAYAHDQKVVIDTVITAPNYIERVDFTVNGVFLGSVRTAPYSFAFIPDNVSSIGNTNELHVSAYDIFGNKADQVVNFTTTR